MPDSIGTYIELKYNSNDPKDAIWVNDNANIILSLVVGLFTVIVGFVVIIAIKKKMKLGMYNIQSFFINMNYIIK